MNTRVLTRISGTMAAALAGWCVLAGAPAAAPAAPGGEAPSIAQRADEPGAGDRVVITFRSGRTVSGEILEQTEQTVKVRVTLHRITTTTTYNKSEILSIKKAGDQGASSSTAGAGVGGAGAVASVSGGSDDDESSDEEGRNGADSGDARVYVVKLDGWFGRDISQTPIRKVIRDAHDKEADYLIFEVDNVWREDRVKELLNERTLDHEMQNFEQFFRAQAIYQVFTNEIPMRWEDPPEIVFWVRQAMGGAAFIPLVSENIYFAPNARMGGVGNLSFVMQGADEVVRQKQISLRLKEAIGAAHLGGHPPEIVRAMTQIEKVYSYRIENGEPVFIEDYPDASRGEILLTDDGQDENTDTAAQLVRGEGNDVLTLDADLARKLGVSKGTVESLNELFFALGISRSHVRVDDRSERIMENWERSLTSAERRLRDLVETLNETQVQGDYDERTRARGVQRRTIEEMISILRRYQEALNPRQIGLPTIAQLYQQIEQIKLAQLADQDD